MFFPCSRIYKQWVQRVWGEEEVGVALRGRDGLKKEEKQEFLASLSLSPHILLLMPATHFQFFPPNFLPPDLLALQFLWIRAAPVFCYYSEFSLLLFCKEVVPEGVHQVESGMVVRPSGLQLRHLQLYFRDHTSTHSHVIPSIIVKQSN